MIAGATTKLLVTRTARLRAAVRAIDPYSALGVLVVALILIAGALNGLLHPQVAAPLPPIVVFATAPLPAPVPVLAGAQLSRGMSRRQPTAAARPTEAPLTVMHVQPTPTAAPAYWQDDQTFVVNAPAPPAVDLPGHVDSQGWTCGATYGDWRDTDPLYTHPECYAK